MHPPHPPVTTMSGPVGIVIAGNAAIVASMVSDMAAYLLGPGFAGFTEWLATRHGHAVDRERTWKSLELLADKFSGILTQEGNSK